ncbi:MAG TPA: NrfD/PsrC family molybdoenzyme membrane anchor subunit [Rhodocyclaceae bacterium]
MDYAASRSAQTKFYLLAGLGALVSAIGVGAALYMEHHGHAVTGMNNQVVWGLPHVFAIFLVVAASGVLNVASIGSVFGKTVYKTRGMLAGLLCFAMLAAGLVVILLDLGRADRIMVAATHVNLTSVFGWNMILYPGMFGIVVVYLWTLMEKRMYPFSKPAGFAAFIWRLLLTTGTGSIFGFLVARQAYQSAVIAPMFIIMSFAWGMAVFMIVQKAMYLWNGMSLHPQIRARLKNLLAVFVGAVFYFVAVYHLTNAYFAKQVEFERFILLDGGIFPLLFWGGWLFVGTILPLILIFAPGLANKAGSVTLASLLVIVGAFCQLYVFIIGGEVFPLDIFPGMTASSSFFDGRIDQYSPSLPEFLLGMGGIGIAFTMVVVGVRVLKFLPEDNIAKLEAAGALAD